MLTDSDAVKAYRKSIMQLMTLNHPVDCGICDKAGECKLQDYHYKYNGSPSISRDAKVRSTKFHALSERIVLDNERCILCSRCVRFTREISKSNALGHHPTRRCVAGARRRRPAARRRPVLGQHHRPLPGRRAALTPVPVQGTGLVSRADAVPSARAARAAARSRSGIARPNGSSTRSTHDRTPGSSA